MSPTIVGRVAGRATCTVASASCFPLGVFCPCLRSVRVQLEEVNAALPAGARYPMRTIQHRVRTQGESQTGKGGGDVGRWTYWTSNAG